MKIKIIVIGKTGKSFLKEGETEYLKRLGHYLNIERIEIPDIKNAKKMSINQIKTEEAKQVVTKLDKGDYVVLLDENGKQRGSEDFANWLQQIQNRGLKHLTFVVGGPYGFSEELYNLANEKISLSKMTFSHQMIRMLFFEQLYRACTILRNEPYHHK
jgi:23S rRNA (pseudouridine1915-N3)-methyltransferase